MTTTVSRHFAITAGGRTCVRRLVFCAALILHAGWALAATAVPADPKVTVEESAGVYQVLATFNVPEPQAIALAVLTDYDHIAEFMPDVRTSRILERSAAGLVVEQEAVAHVLMFSKKIHLVLDIREGPGRIQFTDRCGKSFSRYEGGWTLSSKGGVTSIEYRLLAQPTFDVPEFLLKSLLKRDSTRMIERLRAEFAARNR
jgi:polyketide cyclase/dehydrase/lipid transport protein